MHALIIEDEPLIAMSVEDVLRDCGFTSIEFAISLDSAVAAAKRRCPDLITADVQLTPGCGIDAVGMICASKIIPVIFITATAQDVEAKRPGSIVVHKPFGEEAMRAALSQAIGQAH
jgi:DNA-binding response OmpR family regulator